MAENKRSDTSANVAICQEVWRQANESKTGLEIPCGTMAEASRMRTSLYNAMRNVKRRPEDYPSLADAALNCEIVLKSGEPTILIVRRKELSPRMLALQQVLAAQGVKVEEKRLSGTPETREAQLSIERLQARMEVDAHALPQFPSTVETSTEVQFIPHNPFYSRDKQ